MTNPECAFQPQNGEKSVFSAGLFGQTLEREISTKTGQKIRMPKVSTSKTRQNVKIWDSHPIPHEKSRCIVEREY
jgi:hypothetical protein